MLGGDGKIYCVPTVFAGVLVIDPARRSVALLAAAEALPAGSWVRGALSAADGRIYCVPSLFRPGWGRVLPVILFLRRFSFEGVSTPPHPPVTFSGVSIIGQRLFCYALLFSSQRTGA